MAKFVHLHVHSEYSLLDGLSRLADLVEKAKKLKMEAIALTDHGSMYGTIPFYLAALEAGIKPIIGVEAYMAQRSRFDKQPKVDADQYHLILLAKNNTGYQNLLKLVSAAHLQGFYYKPRIDLEVLKEYKEGLIALTACMSGEIPSLILQGKSAQAEKKAQEFQELFGEDFYLEVQPHPKMPDQEKVNQGMVKVSRQLGIPLVATNDIHYVEPEDAEAQDALLAIQTQTKITDKNRLTMIGSPDFYMRSPDEMNDLFKDYPDTCENTVRIAKKCQVEIELGKWLFPNFEIPKRMKAPDYLREMTKKRLPELYPKTDKEIRKRLNFELDVIIEKGYASYFLMMADLVNWCRARGIATNTRGSAAGSVVSYILGVTTVDPIKYGLPFERFLNPFRPKPPDIDLDIADNRREELIAYIVEKYGQDKVAQICTFGRMLARAAVRDVGRVLGYPYTVPDKIAKLIPLGSQGFPMTTNKALAVSPELRQIYDTDKDARQILDLAKKIEGNVRHASVHAAGIVISPTKMTDYSPLQLEPKGTKTITQYEMHACEDIGLVKFDILGIRNLSILGAAVEIVEKTRGIKIDLSRLPIDDKKTFEMLARGETMGTFQLGGAGMTKWLKELKPNRIEDIMVMIALFRPGPMANIPEFIARKHGTKKVTYLHPKMRDFLGSSYGILVYQEDVLFTALSLAGYNWETVDKLRVAIGKKIPEEMAKQHKIFVEGAQRNSGLTKKEAENIWDLFVPFQGYGFNKAHAASYGIIAYQTAYLKAHYPVEFMAALLTAESDYTDKIVLAVDECRRMKITVLAPDINVSEAGFTIEEEKTSLENKSIRFGLSAIKNVGLAAIEAILQARKLGGDFPSLIDFLHRVDTQKVNKKVLESLIKAGALDRFGKRAAMLTGLDQARSKAEKEQKRKSSGQTSLFEQKEQGEKLSVTDDLPAVEEFSKNELLVFERDLLGFYLTEHPLASSLAILESEISHKLGQVDLDLGIGEKVKIGGILSSLRVVFTKNGAKEMAFGTLEDETGNVDVVIFPSTYAQTRSCWIKDQAVLIEGKVETREENLSVIVEKAVSLSAASQAPKYDFTIRIPKGTSSQSLIKLNQSLKESPGDQKGVLVFEGNGVPPKKLVLSFGVDYSSELKEKIKKLLEKEDEIS